MTRDREDDLPVEGLRERKRRETAERIRETGIRLFMEKGYAATTLEDIAGEAGISRRTFFYYYKSKDDILLTMQNGTGAAVAAALREAPPDKRPFEAVRDAVLRLTASIPHDELIVLDRLMRSGKAASYIQHEQTVFAALRKKWPEPEREAALRWIAMLAIGGLRLSLEAFSREEGKRPLVDFVREAFDTLEHEVGHHGS